jgi:hypothetical protein
MTVIADGPWESGAEARALHTLPRAADAALSVDGSRNLPPPPLAFVIEGVTGPRVASKPLNARATIFAASAATPVFP